MKIAVIFTGGTIGSREEDGNIAPIEGGADKLLDSVSGIWMERGWIRIFSGHPLPSDKSPEEVSYQCSNPLTILSENSTGHVIKYIKEAVENVLHEPETDGVIVVHGTDTLMYTAAALGYLFADSTIPIVLVSSNYVLDAPPANGWDNFCYGVAFIAHVLQQRHGWENNGKLNDYQNRSNTGSDDSVPGGVFVSYRNGDGVPRIHRGCAVIAHQPYSDEINSVLDKEYGYFERDGERCRFVRGSGRDLAISTEHMQSRPHLSAPVTWNAPILQIYPYPGMQYPAIPECTKAILHHSYHSGTICMDKDSNGEVFFEDAKRRGIPVFLSSAYGAWSEWEADDSCGTLAQEGKCRCRAQYESTKDFGRLGIIVLPAASPVAVYMKLWLLLASGEDVLYWMQRGIPGDINIEPAAPVRLSE